MREPKVAPSVPLITEGCKKHIRAVDYLWANKASEVTHKMILKYNKCKEGT